MSSWTVVTGTFVLLLCTLYLVSAADKKLQIGVKKRISPEDCKIKSKKGDKLEMHYTVSCRSCVHIVKKISCYFLKLPTFYTQYV